MVRVSNGCSIETVTYLVGDSRYSEVLYEKREREREEIVGFSRGVRVLYTIY